jgi:thiamine biosynthesis lipoprotein
VPEPAEIDALRPLIGWDKIRWRRPQLVLPVAGMQLDFGGYVKEYAADRVAQLCREQGLRHGLVDLGGDLAVVGPHPDGSPWRVGIRHPRAPRGAIASVALAGGGIATSGDYERCMLVDGKRYAHILNPKTGWPAEGLASVTVAASHCLIAGTASTIAMLKGRAQGPWPTARPAEPAHRVDGTSRAARELRTPGQPTTPRCVKIVNRLFEGATYRRTGDARLRANRTSESLAPPSRSVYDARGAANARVGPHTARRCECRSRARG